MKLYTSGPCTICGIMGDIVVVKKIGTKTLFLYCHGCGIAWGSPPLLNPPPSVEDEILAPETYSGVTIVLPTDEEICEAQRIGWELSPLEPPTEFWEDVLRTGMGQTDVTT